MTTGHSEGAGSAPFSLVSDQWRGAPGHGGVVDNPYGRSSTGRELDRHEAVIGDQSQDVNPVRGCAPSSRWRRLARGVWLPPADAPSLDDRLRAWTLVLPPTGGFTHLTAAEAYGWWLPEAPPHPVFAAMPSVEPRPRHPGLRVFRHPCPPALQEVRGLRLTTPAETLLALARDLAPLDLIVLADSAVRQGDVTIDELARVATGTRRRGAPALRALLPLIDERSESAWESIMRLLHWTADIPVEPQHTLVDGGGAFIARADLWLCGTRRVHEYDGGGHRDPEVHEADLTRDPRHLPGEVGAARLHEASSPAWRREHHPSDR